MKVAVIQNRLGLGGRNVVISEVIKLCNRKGIIPLIFTFSSKKDGEIFKQQFGSKLKFELHPFKGFPFTRGTAYQIPLLNLTASPKLKNFDLVFNSGRCPHFLPDGPFYVHYIHFPVETNLYTMEHFQNIRGAIYTFPLKLLYIGRQKKVTQGTFIANSNFTANAIHHLYTSLEDKNVQIVYPPCSIGNSKDNNNRELDFVSLGSFISDKRQLEQIEIARHFPQFNFHIIGGLKSKRYYDKCRETIKVSRLTNVTLYPDASKSKVDDLLSRSKIFLHTKHYEHFGISTVEGIDRGCLPLVHDSGGSRETVPIEFLRFRDTGEAIQKLEHLMMNFQRHKESFMTLLRSNIQQYSADSFRSKMIGILGFDRELRGLI